MKLKVDVPQPVPQTFHLELTEEEASLVCILMRCVDRNNNPETAKLYEIQEQLHEHLFDTRTYKKTKERMRPNGRIEVGTVIGADADW